MTDCDRLPSGAGRTNWVIEDQRLLVQVRALRARRYSPAEIARSLAINKGEAARLVRLIATESGAGTDERNADTQCWVSPGWRHGLRIADHDDWPADADAGAPSAADDSGVAVVLVAKPNGYRRLEVCSYLLDTWCLGVKNVTGPKRMNRRELDAERHQSFAPWQSHGIPVPLELAQSLVLGVVEFAHELGFEPHRDFARARATLDDWEGPSAITFGMNGKPHYINGPYDDPERVLAKLDRTLGRDRFHFTVSLGEADDVGDGYRYSAVLTDRDHSLSDAA